jgi:hypothetical protein
MQSQNIPTARSFESNAGQTKSTKIGNKACERVEQFRYLVTYRKSIHEEIKSRFNSRNAY